jgi:hypothetical protein
MKLKHILLALCATTLSGCADYLDNAPDDELTLEMVFNDKTRMEGWLANIYDGIPDPYWGMANSIGYDTAADDLNPSQRWITWWGGTLLNWRVGTWYTNSSWNSNFWANLPRKIRSAYIFINNAHEIKAHDVTEEDIETMKYECRFLIAYYYWILTEAYGAVPYFEDEVDVNGGSDVMFRGQRTFDETVNWIDEQMVELSKKLPTKWEESFFGRATSIACLAVRARMLLFAASPLVNGNEMYKGFTNYDGQERFNTTYDASKWTKAAKACKELIDAAEAAGHGLYYEYNDDGSIDPFMSCANVFMKKTSEGNNEILFARPDCNYTNYENHSTPRGCGGNGGLGVTQALVDAFFMKNGLSPILGYNADGSPIINEASGYTESGFTEEPEIRNTKWDVCRKSSGVKDGQITAPDKGYGTFNMYSNREPRFYLTVIFDRSWYWEGSRTTRFKSGEADGGTTHDAPQNGYLQRKKVSLEQHKKNGVHPYRPGILFRMAEAYLNYAEALNECDPGNSDIMKYLNLIRERAGIPQYGSGADMIPAPTTQDDVREAIHKERRVELCCEGIRFNDIRRWKEGEKYLNYTDYGMNFAGTVHSDDPSNPKSFYVRTVHLNRVFTKKQYWFPIYQTEVDKDPTLVQSPFWNE